MPKDRSVPNLIFDRSRASPYTCNSKNTEKNTSKSCLQSVGEEKEWEEARCPICMEHPHNAVLLLCSSHEMGCHPYMCDTSHRHSNCFDQFCKSSATTPSTDLSEEVPLSGAAYHGGSEEQRQHIPRRIHGRQLQPNLLCPLCRGQINGWIIVKPARMFMNSKPRSCSLETCDFSGTYSELRKHARFEHPSARPSEADPNRHSDWMRLEHDQDLQDILGASELESGDELSRWMSLEGALEGYLDAFQSEFEDEWNNTLHMEIGLGLPFTYYELSFSTDSLDERRVFGSLGASGQSHDWGTTAMMMVDNPPRDDSLNETNWRTTAMMMVGNPPRVDSLNETGVSGRSGASGQSHNWRTTGRMRIGSRPRVYSLNETSLTGSSGASGQSRNWRTPARMRVGNHPSLRVDSLNETSVSGSSDWRTPARMGVGNPPSPRVDPLQETSVSGSSETSSPSHNSRTTARMRVGVVPRRQLASRRGDHLSWGIRSNRGS